MGGHFSPMGCCDRECALVNGCTVGGVQCEWCGNWFCASELDADGLCDECAEAKAEADAAADEEGLE